MVDTSGRTGGHLAAGRSLARFRERRRTLRGGRVRRALKRDTRRENASGTRKP
ncbi:MAG TPA: hypothetical protein VEW05_13440 [Candidatus Polarisedimenticolia bacterium]|nr:hypothetical protein [Candidatus Polarisedimenticolia bacterium]